MKSVGSWSVLAVLAIAAALVAPTALSFSSGANKETVTDPNFAAKGCANAGCHGNAQYAAGAEEVVHWAISSDGTPLAGNTYEAGKTYTISITLDETNEPSGGATGHHAGFNLRASAGKLEAVGGVSKVTGDGSQATHVNAESTTWNVTWTPPEDDSVAIFELFVNDVDADGSPSAGDMVYRLGFWLTNSHGEAPGAAADEHQEFGISLQQYWIGLLGLFGMVVVMVAGFVYLKFANPHNSDAQDR